jgi:integrase
VPCFKVGDKDVFDLIVTNRKRYGNQEGPFPFSAQYVTDAMNVARSAAGLNPDNLDERLRIHDLRAHAITRMLRAGVDPYDVMRVSGHKNVKTFFKHYVRPTVGDVRKAIEIRMAKPVQPVVDVAAKIAELEAQLAALKAAQAPQLKLVA